MLRIYTGGGCPVNSASPYNRKADSFNPACLEQRYDQVRFSSRLDESNKRVKETVGRLSQEARTRVTAQDIEHLRQQVANGDYQPVPREIAARMLLLRKDG